MTTIRTLMKPDEESSTLGWFTESGDDIFVAPLYRLLESGDAMHPDDWCLRTCKLTCAGQFCEAREDGRAFHIFGDLSVSALRVEFREPGSVGKDNAWTMERLGDSDGVAIATLPQWFAATDEQDKSNWINAFKVVKIASMLTASIDLVERAEEAVNECVEAERPFLARAMGLTPEEREDAARAANAAAESAEACIRRARAYLNCKLKEARVLPEDDLGSVLGDLNIMEERVESAMKRLFKLVQHTFHQKEKSAQKVQGRSPETSVDPIMSPSKSPCKVPEIAEKAREQYRGFNSYLLELRRNTVHGTPSGMFVHSQLSVRMKKANSRAARGSVCATIKAQARSYTSEGIGWKRNDSEHAGATAAAHTTEWVSLRGMLCTQDLGLRKDQVELEQYSRELGEEGSDNGWVCLPKMSPPRDGSNLSTVMRSRIPDICLEKRPKAYPLGTGGIVWSKIGNGHKNDTGSK